MDEKEFLPDPGKANADLSDADIPYAGPPKEAEPDNWKAVPYLPEHEFSPSPVESAAAPRGSSEGPCQDSYQDPAMSDQRSPFPVSSGVPVHSRLAKGALIAGLLALIMSLIPFVQLPLSSTAIVLVILHYRKYQVWNGFAIAGLVMGLFGVIISFLMTLYWGYIFSMMHDPAFMETYQNLLNQLQP